MSFASYGGTNYDLDTLGSIQEWARNMFTNDCLLRDLAMQPSDRISDDEYLMLTCAYEGWLAAGGRHASTLHPRATLERQR
jgi:hypothetical protein